MLNAFAGSTEFYALGATLYREEFWLVHDRLGSPRMIVDKSGSLAGVKRQIIMPFGEELSGVGQTRTIQFGYTGDSTRQRFTGYEDDSETGLNFAEARYQSPTQGRFTSVDPLGRSATIANPQSFNRYSYVQNNPTNATDPTGMMMMDASMGYGDVSGMWMGGAGDDHFGAFETGRNIIDNGMNYFADRVNNDSAGADPAAAPEHEEESGHAEESTDSGREHTDGPEASGTDDDPQNPVTDNPSTIDNHDARNQACQISVSFTGSSNGLEKGPGRVGSVYGIGFGVNISGIPGNYFTRSTTNDPTPKGSWIIEQVDGA